MSKVEFQTHWKCLKHSEYYVVIWGECFIYNLILITRSILTEVR